VTAYPKSRQRKKTINFVWTLTFEGLTDRGGRVRQFLEGLSARPELILESRRAAEVSEALESPRDIQAEFYPQNGDVLQAADEPEGVPEDRPESREEQGEEWALF